MIKEKEKGKSKIVKYKYRIFCLLDNVLAEVKF